MPKFEILISRGNLVVSNHTMEVEAPTQEEAESKAMELAPEIDTWKEAGEEDYNYQVEETTGIHSDECIEHNQELEQREIEKICICEVDE